ncbi:hypothetical protein N665_1047s0010 [Sinapis alba]|nr:hypothetical protein N665_1047s0010 [Sinapis alba]
MGSSAGYKSAHMADIKGKGILYEDDDETIQLTNHDDSQVIKEFHMSLIGKVLNPKNQNVDKLIQSMPNQWGMQDRITADDLGNGKFLFNFSINFPLKRILTLSLDMALFTKNIVCLCWYGGSRSYTMITRGSFCFGCS